MKSAREKFEGTVEIKWLKEKLFAAESPGEKERVRAGTPRDVNNRIE